MNWNFENLDKLCVAVYASNIDFNYQTAILTMTLEPSYGYDESIHDKVFQVRFDDCVYFASDNTSKSSEYLNKKEFIAWGKSPIDCCSDEQKCFLFTNLLARQLNPDPALVCRVNKNDAHKYFHYFFQNPSGDRIEVLAANVEFKELAA